MQCEGLKKERNEYIEEMQDDSLPLTSHGPTQATAGHGYQVTTEANTESNKEKRPMKAPVASMLPLLSPMSGSAPSMAPSSSSMPDASWNAAQ